LGRDVEDEVVVASLIFEIGTVAKPREEIDFTLGQQEQYPGKLWSSYAGYVQEKNNPKGGGDVLLGEREWGSNRGLSFEIVQMAAQRRLVAIAGWFGAGSSSRAARTMLALFKTGQGGRLEKMKQRMCLGWRSQEGRRSEVRVSV
jgi:hypothetical protein